MSSINENLDLDVDGVRYYYICHMLFPRFNKCQLFLQFCVLKEQLQFYQRHFNQILHVNMVSLYMAFINITLIFALVRSIYICVGLYSISICIDRIIINDMPFCLDKPFMILHLLLLLYTLRINYHSIFYVELCFIS